MNFLELAEKRQSTRKYSDKPVSRELINKCLEAARLAPSACNSQPWEFIVVDDKKTRELLNKKAFAGIYKMNSFANNAPVLIVVATKKSKMPARLAGQFRGTKYSLIDIGIACDHLTLEAAELKLGTCWIGWFNERWIKKSLKLPFFSKIHIVISMGYSETDEPRPKNRKPFDEIARFI